MFDRALEAEPRCERNAAHEFLGNSGEIEHNQAEAAALQDEIGGFEDLFEAVFVNSTKSFRVVGAWWLGGVGTK